MSLILKLELVSAYIYKTTILKMPVILNWKDVNPSTDFRYYEPRSSSSGHDGFNVKVEVLDKKTQRYVPFLHVGPELKIPFGLDRKEQPNGPAFRCAMTFPGVLGDGKTIDYSGPKENVDYLKWLKSIDENNKNKALAQCQSWFKKDISKDIIDEFYFHNITNSTKPAEYSPTFATKLKFRREVFQTEFYNQLSKKIEYEDIPAGATVIPLIETMGLWFAGKSFGMSFKINQLMVFEKDQFDGCAIVNPHVVASEDEIDQAVVPSFILAEDHGSKRQRVA